MSVLSIYKFHENEVGNIKKKSFVYYPRLRKNENQF